MRLLMILALAVLLLPVASAEGVHRVQTPFADTVTLQEGDHAAFVFEMEPGDLLSANVTVESGAEVDVYFTSFKDYEAYVDPNSSEFRFYPALSAIATRGYSESLVPPSGTPATYVLIIDNTELWSAGSSPTGEVQVHVSLSAVSGGVLGVGLNGPALFGIMALLMFACAAVGHLVGLRRGEARARARPAKASTGQASIRDPVPEVPRDATPPQP